MSQSLSQRLKTLSCISLGLLILAIGIFMALGGVYLISLGGSWYFALAGLGLIGSGVSIARKHPAGAALYLAILGATVVWSVWDAGLNFWPLFSRLFAPAVLAVPVLLTCPAIKIGTGQISKRAAYGSAAFILLALGMTGYEAFQPRPLVVAENLPHPRPGIPVGADAQADWSQWGRTPSGTRFAPLEQITPRNVAHLRVAWTYRTGEIPTGPEGFVVTPLAVNGMLYGCTQSNVIFALDPDTGQERWRFDPHAHGNLRPRCRGVGYHDAFLNDRSALPALPGSPATLCTRRIISTTVDDRMIAVDANSGQPCTDFGDHGVVSLRTGMGPIKPGFYFPTAAPTIVHDLVIVGGLVWDNAEVGEPSGVVRAFNVQTGALVWAWDLGDPAYSGLPPQGQTYTRGTPNVWSTPAYDEALGLVYLPTGNATPDFWGAHRSAADERYSSSIVALDIATGQERWRFQTVHHDLWDYDVPSQPALYNVPDGRGGTIPALIQTTKRGQIFMLDRRTGKPVADVQERSVPHDTMADDHAAPTQPYSVGMPAIGTRPLDEHRMWGITPLDQMMCRINFRRAHYEGDFTPPGDRTAIHFPGWFGGMNWGSVSIAENLGYLIVNDIRMGVTTRLIPRALYDAAHHGPDAEGTGAAQAGTPWGVVQGAFVSPLGIPCQAPPYGTLTAIDLATRKIAWQIPMGTVQDLGPFDLPTHLPIPIGMPTRGGPVTTGSGLIFMAGTQDFYLRAMDVRTGRELWKGRLPVGAETTPMTYVSAHSGRQFVVIAAGGTEASRKMGDYVVAFALPDNGR
ncbi:membrane-bound PQQ-dependent dehydrogenase, glucose/quinate/shikimate family [Komagataeibacter sp. FNDCF1]|uniref:membrane-bound PQQ-dependent dehydrogenase, glucose/quinate/shikimate family n=1 Tax=Komagataeibacter sp. FNDCF1 TaxID=2878681 RepID=UPI001E4BBACB|nr:membrane-bound PQQ-dependent dehydrogenase, glucose/quinate/shikimate family [Komagataeibacter sp. FNDCF1]MCE2564807.1 membrane-bound PQQ-dependent dehydrogenase, glucose/quinate/shikimate family [Komagataeibacter sp. FNDCF1]